MCREVHLHECAEVCVCMCIVVGCMTRCRSMLACV
jgi:hypothetical protein